MAFTYEDAYAEACKVIGELTMEKRLRQIESQVAATLGTERNGSDRLSNRLAEAEEANGSNNA